MRRDVLCPGQSRLQEFTIRKLNDRDQQTQDFGAGISNALAGPAGAVPFARVIDGVRFGEHS
jgi:hypothetical protein